MGVSTPGPIYTRDLLLFLGFVLGLPGALGGVWDRGWDGGARGVGGGVERQAGE